MHQKLTNAYTLVELLVVIALIGLLAAFGSPAFSKYGKNTDFKQKAEELRQIFVEANNLAANPETAAVSDYRVYFDNTDLTAPKYDLVSCQASGSDDCATANTVKEIKLLKSEVIQIATINGGIAQSRDWLVKCPALLVDGKAKCTLNDVYIDPTVKIGLIRDDDSAVSAMASFTFKSDPFAVVFETAPIN